MMWGAWFGLQGQPMLDSVVVRAFPDLSNLHLPTAALNKSAEPILRSCTICSCVLFADASVVHSKK